MAGATPDRAAPDPRSRPLHLRPTSLALVFVGGSVGVGLREALTLLFPAAPGGVGWVVLVINVCGAFLLGWLLEALARRGPDTGRRRSLRLLFGTGVLGGFTTYSGLATDTALLLGSGSVAAGTGYALGTVLFGGLATWLGIAVAVLTRRRVPPGGVEPTNPAGPGR